MKAKRIIIPFVLMVFVFCLFLSPNLAASQRAKKEKKEAKTEEAIRIPKEVKLVLQEGLAERQGRMDIPFTLIKHFYMPAGVNIHSIFLFRMKNVDLGFMPQAFALVAKEEAEEEEEEEETLPPETEVPPVLLQSNLNIFLQFYHLEDENPVEIVKEVYIPVKLQVESTSYDPEKEEIYTTAYPLPPGEYLLAMAVTTPDLQKIGTQYIEFSLPDPNLFTENLETTPFFFVKELKRMDTPETTAEAHQGFFTYSVLQIESKIENVFSQGEDLDILFFIFGAQPTEEQKWDIGVNYEVFQDEELVIHFEAITYESPLISQPLPMKRTFRITSEEGERTERKDLDPGKYTLSVNIKDNVSGKSLDKKIDFEIK